MLPEPKTSICLVLCFPFVWLFIALRHNHGQFCMHWGMVADFAAWHHCTETRCSPAGAQRHGSTISCWQHNRTRCICPLHCVQQQISCTWHFCLAGLSLCYMWAVNMQICLDCYFSFCDTLWVWFTQTLTVNWNAVNWAAPVDIACFSQQALAPGFVVLRYVTLLTKVQNHLVQHTMCCMACNNLSCLWLQFSSVLCTRISEPNPICSWTNWTQNWAHQGLDNI